MTIAVRLQNSKKSKNADVTRTLEYFDKPLKLIFKGPKEKCFVPLGLLKDEDDSIKLKDGRMEVAGCAFSFHQ